MFTLREIADIYKVKPVTIRRLMVKGLPYLMVGGSIRFDGDKVRLWFEENQKG